MKGLWRQGRLRGPRLPPAPRGSRLGRPLKPQGSSRRPEGPVLWDEALARSRSEPTRGRTTARVRGGGQKPARRAPPPPGLGGGRGHSQGAPCGGDGQAGGSRSRPGAAGRTGRQGGAAGEEAAGPRGGAGAARPVGRGSSAGPLTSGSLRPPYPLGGGGVRASGPRSGPRRR